MVTAADVQIAGHLREAVRQLNSENYKGAETCLRRALSLNGADPVANCLLGVARFGLGDYETAERALRTALSVDPAQPQIVVHLSRTLRALGRPEEAAAVCAGALSRDRSELRLLMELAMAQEEAGAFTEAANSYSAFLREAPGVVEAERRLAALLNRLGRADDAEAVLSRALMRLQTDPAERARLHHDLGWTLKSMRRHEEALVHLDQAVADAPGDLQIQTRRAVVLQHLGRFDEAIEALTATVASAPLDMDAHIQLNELLYRQARDAEFLRSYDEAGAAAPGSALPHTAKGHHLLKLNRPQEAQESFARALAADAANSSALAGLARALEALGQADAAWAAHQSNLSLHPNDLTALVDGGSFLLRASDAKGAVELAGRAHALYPESQEALALLGLCYRALGDEAEYRLNDYDRLVRAIDLEAPRGFATMAEFNQALEAYLHGLHNDRREHFTQTLRGGTRLYDQLFNNGHELVERLRGSIERAVAQYVSELPDDQDHPFTARRSRTIGYAGSWSSRLRDSGFHVNHIHPEGWISSAYYVAAPDVVSDEKRREGWLKFGEPTTDFGDRFGPRKFVQPVPGRLVLFPSYLWHGTTPFRSPQTRTTIAFDLLP